MVSEKESGIESVSVMLLESNSHQASRIVERAIETHFSFHVKTGPRVDLTPTQREQIIDSETGTIRGEYALGFSHQVMDAHVDSDYGIVITELPLHYFNRVHMNTIATPEHSVGMLSISDLSSNLNVHTNHLRVLGIYTLGTLLGIEQCLSDSCVMQFTGDVMTLSKQEEYICDTCAETIGHDRLKPLQS